MSADTPEKVVINLAEIPRNITPEERRRIAEKMAAALLKNSTA